MEENRYTVKLTKVPLASERKEKQDKKRKRILILSACVVIFVIGIIIGYVVSSVSNSYLYKDEHSKFDKIMSVMRNNWLYSDDYEDVSKELQDRAYYGMTTFEEDPYTTYMSKEELDSFSDSINQNYVGIGVMYSSFNDIPEITRVYPNTPAETAGIQVGDIIVKVDDTEITKENIETLADYVKGEEGTLVKITVLRDAKELPIVVKRGAVDTTTYGYEKDGYAYLEIASFGENTCEDCEKYLDSFNSKKLIIDLRDDTGGYQTAVADIAGLFIGPHQVYMKQEYADDTYSIDKTGSDIKKHDFDKIVVLVNEQTASAAEVLAICLREQLQNVTLVGMTTFGKGVVQSTTLIEDGSALKYTSSKWLSPVKGKWINGEGITPDEEIRQDDLMYETVVDMDEDTVYDYDNCSAAIRLAQMSLKFLDYDMDRIDGYYDEKTVEAIRQFKVDHNIGGGDGLDYLTYRAIISAANFESSTNDEKDIQLQRAIELVLE